MNKTFLNRSRKKKLDALMQDDFVMVHLATKAPGLSVPDELKSETSVTLKLSFWFKGKVELKEEVIEANLSFGGSSYPCIIPYDAIWAVTSFDNKFELWDIDLKDDLTNIVSPGKTKEPKAKTTEKLEAETTHSAPLKPNFKSNLSLAHEDKQAVKKDSTNKKSSKRPTPLLRRVK